MELAQEQCLPAHVCAPCVGTMVASGGYDGLLNVYSDPSKPTPKLSLRVGIYIYSSRHLCLLLLPVTDASMHGIVYLHCYFELQGHASWINSVSFSGSGKIIAAAAKVRLCRLH